MRRSIAIVAFLSLLASWTLGAQPTGPRTTVIHCGTLPAVPGEPARPRVSIVTEGDRIVEVVGDPLMDLSILLDVRFVMARGTVFKKD